MIRVTFRLCPPGRPITLWMAAPPREGEVIRLGFKPGSWPFSCREKARVSREGEAWILSPFDDPAPWR